jgi:hypothetical protein
VVYISDLGYAGGVNRRPKQKEYETLLKKQVKQAGLMPAILTIWEAEILRMVV